MKKVLNAKKSNFFKSGFLVDNRGAIAVEFALVVPVLAILLVGMLDFGQMINRKMQISTLANIGAEYATQNSSDTVELKNFLESVAPFDATGLTATVTETCECDDGTVLLCSESCGGGEQSMRFYNINVSQPYELDLNIIGLGAFDLSSDSVIRLR